MRKTKIICTLGPSTDDEEVLRQLMESGMNVARFNFSHQSHDKHLKRLLELLGLENRKTHLPNQLSGGQQQRTSIGRALITNPTIVLADEPTGNLDSKSSDEIVALLKKSNREYKQTIIMITHNMEIAKCADRIIKIEDGKIVKGE